MSTRKKLQMLAMASALAAVAAISVPLSAQAAVTCGPTQEVCRETVSSGTKTSVIVRTSSNVSGSATAYYDVRKGPTGAVICSGQMGFNQTKVCQLGGYSGQVTFAFFKGQSNTVTVSNFPS